MCTYGLALKDGAKVQGLQKTESGDVGINAGFVVGLYCMHTRDDGINRLNKRDKNQLNDTTGVEIDEKKQPCALLMQTADI